VGLPGVGDVTYKQKVVRHSQEPYQFQYSCRPTEIITGIACVPLDDETQSPEAEVLHGGVNHDFVTIRLVPVEEGEWACDVSICVRAVDSVYEISDIEYGSNSSISKTAPRTRSPTPTGFRTGSLSQTGFRTRSLSPAGSLSPTGFRTGSLSPAGFRTGSPAPPTPPRTRGRARSRTRYSFTDSDSN
jgi:hypothetical protein